VNHTTPSAMTPFLRTVFQALRGVFGGGGRSGAPSVKLVAAITLSVLATLVVGTILSLPPHAHAATQNSKIGEIRDVGGTLSAESVAVNDHNGHIYVADSQSRTIRDYSSASDTNPVIWSGAATPATEFTGMVAVAVDNSTGDVYVSDSGQALVFKFDESGNLISSFGDTTPAHNGQLAGLETTAGSFAPPGPVSWGIAVDQATHNLYVLDAGHEVIDGFSAEGEYLPAISIIEKPGELYGCGGAYTNGIAVNGKSGDVLVSDSCDLKVYAFDLATATLDTAFGDHVVPAGEPNEGQPEPDGTLSGLDTPATNFGTYISVAAADSSGYVYVSDAANGVIDVFDSAGHYQGQIRGLVDPIQEGVSVDQATGDVYLARFNSAVSTFSYVVEIFGPTVITPDVATLPGEVHSVTSATFKGEVNPLAIPLTECVFEYGLTTAYGETAPCESPGAAEIPVDSSFHPVHADLATLTPGATYHYRLRAANANGFNNQSADQTLFTGASIDTTSAYAVTDSTATLATEINPRGVATTYRFEYGPTSSYGTSVPIPDGSAGSGSSPVTRSAAIGSLQPLTTYHFRVVATNALGTVLGPDRTFTTQGASASLLPDDRAWELVSPPDKHGIPLGALSEGNGQGSVVQAATDGSAISYMAYGSATGDAEGNITVMNSQLLSRRSPSGWTTQDITTPHRGPVGFTPGSGSEYKLFSPDLSRAALVPFGITPLSPLTTEKSPYIRQSDGTFNPVVIGCPPDPTPCPPDVAAAANVPPGTVFGGKEEKPELSVNGSVRFITATPDLSALLLESPMALTDEFDSSYVPTYQSPGNIYEWNAGSLRLVSYIPPPSAIQCGSGGPTCVPASEEGQASRLGNESSFVRNAVSNDGHRVVFAEPGGLKRMFLRDLALGQTIQLDAPEAGCTSCDSGGAAGAFELASDDGSRVFFTDELRLTEDSTAGATAAGGHRDLYMCEVVEEGGHLACDLTDLTANQLKPSEPADVQGHVIGAATDGSVLYFVANGILTDEPNSRGESPVSGNCVGGGKFNQGSGLCNLYRYDVASEATSLVAVLSDRDAPSWGLSYENLNLAFMTGRVSPNGRYLAFMSRRSPTGYDNRDVKTGDPDQEVFLYDSQADSGAGNLVCASCNPTGARPRGIVDPGGYPGLLVDRGPIWLQGLAGAIPGWTTLTLSNAIYQSRYLSDSGRLFFNAADSLVPSDQNGTFDVYQFEFSAGSGQPESNDCSLEAPTFSGASGGCISLISSGASPEESAFLDASESGDDVFFLTAAKLAPRDIDGALDIYDARVGGGESEPVKPVECSGDACQQPAVPPNDATPGSLTFNGAGNVTECPKGKVKQKGKCVKKKAKKHKKHHKKNGKKSKRAAQSKRGGGR
jgi:hypothetical protein